MDVSIFLAEFWGWYFIIFFAILSVYPARVKQMIADLNDEKFLLLAAFIGVIIGLLSVLFHNIWEFNWKGMITLIGWGVLLEGVLLFSIPKQTIKWLKVINFKFIQLIYFLLLIVGILLLNVVYSIVEY